MAIKKVELARIGSGAFRYTQPLEKPVPPQNPNVPAKPTAPKTSR